MLNKSPVKLLELARTNSANSPESLHGVTYRMMELTKASGLVAIESV